MHVGQCCSIGKGVKRLLFAFILVGLFSWSLYGQGTSATVLGTVKDASGAVIPNATVQVKNTGTDQTQSVRTNPQGLYTIVDLAIGTYDGRPLPMGSRPACTKTSRSLSAHKPSWTSP
jgi:hypothetical protein